MYLALLPKVAEFVCRQKGSAFIQFDLAERMEMLQVMSRDFRLTPSRSLHHYLYTGF